MSILGNNNENLGSSSFHQFKKQASFFFKEKIKTARLALTDITPAQLLVEESTNDNPWAPDARTLKMISKAAFEIDDYWRIVNVLHNRLGTFDAKNWRIPYKAVVVLEYLLTHGPESVAEEFQTHKDVILEMTNFQYIDEKGFNWGLNVRMKSERILKFLNDLSILKEERAKARKLSRGIEGFGSFNQRNSSENGVQQQLFQEKFKRSNSQFIEQQNIKENQILTMIQDDNSKSRNLIKLKNEHSGSGTGTGLSDNVTVEKLASQWSLKENMVPKEDHVPVPSGESNPLLGDRTNVSRVMVDEANHPFNDEDNEAKVSLI
ncbi:putative ENTH domain-containing protein [Helianthus annuus]|uniref:ENTH domain-containing protein n=1 Tax=Helianthus annuus TaxID=4232 RepID=A0A251UB38_HELAN|nr:clathrin interactor 1 [Helianthus annuus]KAF5797142.1 putative ENTH domain-containing protein [Helianthus annuus]KAJ0548889.1 putative ENTH domain-containing protein [Helianthus annuus]KAJ0555116.1 putative ENTH domain-containing protein [Helianthus annuus]KAJ0723865.1 putative ENTH domain-containing protein [Helianthus annuus]KAJ0899754.1 putative ENTH domain-containing protein [Helianthus annuus]